MDIDEITNKLKKKRELIDLEIQKEEELKEKKDKNRKTTIICKYKKSCTKNKETYYSR